MERKAGIYTRISRLAAKERNKEGAGLGVTRQRDDCVALARQLGWDVADIYVDDDTSAYKRKPRKDYSRLLADLEAGRISAVLCWHTDRLHRSPAELETYIDVCEPRGVVTHTVKAGDIDLSTPSGRMIARQLGVMARYEVEHMAERQQGQKIQAAAAGQWLGGRRPFGFKADGVTLEPEEAAEIVKATDDILAHVSLHAVTRDLYDHGVLTTAGNTWRRENLRRMLMRPRNAGIMVHKGQEVGPAVWPPVISEDKFRAVVSLLANPNRRTSTGGPVRKYLGSGLYRCGVCDDGTTLRASSAGGYDGNSRPAYRCRREDTSKKHLVRSIAVIDRYVPQVLIERLSLPDAREWAEQPDVDVSGLHTEATALRQRLDAIAGMFGRLELDIRAYSLAKRETESRLEEIETQLAQAATVTPLVKIVGAEDVGAAWEGLNLGEQRAIIAGVASVTVHPGGRGRKAGGGYFDPNTVTVRFLGDD